MATIRKLSKADDRAGFTCGDDDLDRFFRQHAGVATAATGQGLLNYFLRAINCGAITEDEAIERAGLTLAELRTRSFLRILEGRKQG